MPNLCLIWFAEDLHGGNRHFKLHNLIFITYNCGRLTDGVNELYIHFTNLRNAIFWILVFVNIYFRSTSADMYSETTHHFLPSEESTQSGVLLPIILGVTGVVVVVIVVAAVTIITFTKIKSGVAPTGGTEDLPEKQPHTHVTTVTSHT